jgi:hypothetical protein
VEASLVQDAVLEESTVRKLVRRPATELAEETTTS